MKHRIGALLLCIGLLLSLGACSATEENGTGTVPSVYTPTVTYANAAQGNVEITEGNFGHILKNSTARLDFGTNTEGLKALTSRQTEETLLKNTFITTLTTTDGRTATITGGEEQINAGQYGVSHRRTAGTLSIAADPTKATVLKEFDLSDKDGELFTALNNDLSAEQTDRGLSITSEGKNRSQFGARFLDIPLENHGRYYLSLTLKADGLTGIKCFFSTDRTPLTENTLLGSLSLSPSGDFITLTAEIQNEYWDGTLQTLLFRLPEGELGTLEIARIALLTADDVPDEGVADTLWTVYSDRIYFSQTLTFNEIPYQSAQTLVVAERAKCTEVAESEHAVSLKMIDGSILGFVRPAEGATLRVETDGDELRLIFDWDLTAPLPMLALRIYLDHTDSTAELEKLAKEERNPLSAENFSLQGATFDRYDRRGGMYRLERTGDEVSVDIDANDRTVYMHILPKENTAWSVYDKDGNRLPIFAGATFPICADGNALTLCLKGQPAAQEAKIPSFFPDSGLTELSRASTVLNGLCTQQTTVFSAGDGSYTVTLTATKLNGGSCTVYDIRYDFLGRKEVSDLLRAFPFFSFELSYGFDEYFYLNGENQSVTLPAGSEEIAYLGSMPFVGLRGDTEEGGWLITKCAMTEGGIPSAALPALHYEEVSEQNTNKLYLSFDAGEVSFVRGDTLTAQVIRVDRTGGEEGLKTLRSEGNFRLIQTESKSAEAITATGMEETVILRLEGFSDYRFPSLKADGEAFTPEYHVYVDGKGYYGFAFSVKTGSVITME